MLRAAKGDNRMSYTFEAIPQFSKMLHNLDRWIDKAVDHAKAKSFEVDVLVGARLAPDQLSFDRQVQSACDAAKFGAAYLSGKTPPSHPDVEKTMAELKQRIATVCSYLETFQDADFAGAEERRVAPTWMHGKWVRGDHYLQQLATPNFGFHVTTAYSILRHNGVPLGKMDFIGALPVRD
jgi:hypothetical protein